MSTFLARNLLYLRKKRGLIQSEAATALGLTRSTYANYENDQTEPPYELLEKFVLFYGTNAHDLLFTNLQDVGDSEKTGEKINVKNVGDSVGDSVGDRGKKSRNYDFNDILTHIKDEGPGEPVKAGVKQADKPTLNAVLALFKPIAEYIAALGAEVTDLRALVEELSRKVGK